MKDGEEMGETGGLIEGGKTGARRVKRVLKGREVQVWERDIYVSDYRGGAALNSAYNP